MLPPPSPRLRFRTWTPDDSPLAEALWCDEDVTHFFGGAMTPPQAHARLDAERARERRLGMQYWPIELRDTGAFAGCAGLRPWQYSTPDLPTIEIGVHLMRSAWGSRLGEEAMRAVLTHAFTTLHLPRVVAGHGAAHTASQKLLERVGFTYTHNALWGPHSLDVRWYTLPAWQPPPTGE